MSARGPHAGYIFAIADPIKSIEGKKEVLCYVGVSHEPWISIDRIMRRPPSSLKKWVDDVHQTFPEGLVVYGEIICSLYHGDIAKLPPPSPGLSVLNWKILDFEEEEPATALALPIRITQKTKKTIWIQRLIEQGHPILNGDSGRPKKPKTPAGAGRSLQIPPPSPAVFDEMPVPVTQESWDELIAFFRERALKDPKTIEGLSPHLKEKLLGNNQQ